MIAYFWDGEVKKSDNGFPRQQPPIENYDWTTPINYAEGTFYMRAEIRSQPVAQQDLHLQFCMWQEKNGNNFGLEMCTTPKQNVPGNPGTVYCWDQAIADMFGRDNPIEWDRPRHRAAVPIKKGGPGTGGQDAVSDFNDWNWNGEDPDEWYPLDMKFTVVIVAKDATFSGWDSYGMSCP